MSLNNIKIWLSDLKEQKEEEEELKKTLEEPYKMKTLKELTWEHHKEAERQEFVKILMSGKINHELYANYLFNQHQCYNIVEPLAMAEGLLDKFPMIRRAQKSKKTLTNFGLILITK